MQNCLSIFGEYSVDGKVYGRVPADVAVCPQLYSLPAQPVATNGCQCAICQGKYFGSWKKNEVAGFVNPLLRFLPRLIFEIQVVQLHLLRLLM